MCFLYPTAMGQKLQSPYPSSEPCGRFSSTRLCRWWFPHRGGVLKDFAVMDLAVLAARFDEGAVVLVARKTLYMRLVMIYPDHHVVVRHWRLPPSEFRGPVARLGMC